MTTLFISDLHLEGGRDRAGSFSGSRAGCSQPDILLVPLPAPSRVGGTPVLAPLSLHPLAASAPLPSVPRHSPRRRGGLAPAAAADRAVRGDRGASCSAMHRGARRAHRRRFIGDDGRTNAPCLVLYRSVIFAFTKLPIPNQTKFGSVRHQPHIRTDLVFAEWPVPKTNLCHLAF